ncbi:MAG: aminotransferase class V-fold PLP-dependent enzyme [Candidatus Eremiobacteraeota bacterium]|nr:aminotransferase class V-fold PLP-dependent enzyme [Candidatus Eremiobacteraeota bacterium]
MTTPLSREEFSVTRKYAYFNHAAVGVLPQSSRRALTQFVDDQAEGGVMGVFGYELKMPEYRERFGNFIGAQGDEIAFLRNTGDGASILAAGVRWEAGDELLLCDNEFPSNALPWLTVRERGVAVRFVETANQRLTPDILRAQMTAKTKVVTVSWVSFNDGYRHDLASLAEVAHERGALFCVDAIQGLGAFPLDVRACNIDALYGSGAKWMLSLQGVGYFYLRASLLDRLQLASPGWRSVADMWDFLNYDQPLRDDAGRFEGGTPNFIGALSIASAVELLERAGVQRIADHVLMLTDRLESGLRGLGARIASLRGPGVSSGILTFGCHGTDPIALGKRLQHEGIITTYRANGIRISPHGYNTTDEVDHLLDVVKSALLTPASP